MRRLHTNWMGNLLASQSPYAQKPINSIMIPGSHDSGTFGMGESTRTQSLNIQQQLEMGIRYFDCRVRINSDTYYFYHTIGSDNDLGTKSDDPVNNPVSKYALAQMRRFLINHPNEILILKFQDFSQFKSNDYLDLVKLLQKYLEFDVQSPNASKCRLTKMDMNTATIESLNTNGDRVFVFFDEKDVPTNNTSVQIWQAVFKYRPVLAKGTYDLWDPYWGDDSNLSVNDTDTSHMQDFWDWHKNNLTTWNGDGFFVLQSHMQELHISGNGSGECMYYNIAEKVADSNYYMNQNALSGDFYSNNHRNITHYINWYKAGTIVNIITFDYAQHGNVCDALVDFYTGTAPAHDALSYTNKIYLKLNALNRFLGPVNVSNGTNFATLDEQGVVLMLLGGDNITRRDEIKDGDTVMIASQQSDIGNDKYLSTYTKKDLYYYNTQSDHEKWVIRNGKTGSVIKIGDHVWLENVSYTGQFLTLNGCYLTTSAMDLPTHWKIVKTA